MVNANGLKTNEKEIMNEELREVIGYSTYLILRMYILEEIEGRKLDIEDLVPLSALEGKKS